MNKHIILGIIILIMLVSFCGCTEQSKNSSDGDTIINTGNSDLEIISYNVTTFVKTGDLEVGGAPTGIQGYGEDGFYHHEDSYSYTIKGWIKNIGNEPYFDIEIIINFYDSSGDKVYNITENLNLICVGEEIYFTTSFYKGEDNFDKVESLKFAPDGTIWSDAATDSVIDGKLSGSTDGSVSTWRLTSLFDSKYHYLLDSDGKAEFSMQQYGEFVKNDHVILNGELVELPYDYAFLIDSISYSTTPNIRFKKDDTNHKIKINYIESEDYKWGDFEITGDCNTSDLGEFVDLSYIDVITECSGEITITHIETGIVYASYTFEELCNIEGILDYSQGNIALTIDSCSIDPSDVKILVSAPPGIGTYLYDPDPDDPMEYSTCFTVVLDPETLEVISEEGYDYVFMWLDVDSDGKIGPTDSLMVYNNPKLDSDVWQFIILHREIDHTFYDSGPITIT